MAEENQIVAPKQKKRGPLGIVLALLGALLSLVYLLNFSMGLLELPDNLPLVGNIDEFLAAAVLLASLRYLGVDLLRFAAKRKPKRD